jgi:hypothetical protein
VHPGDPAPARTRLAADPGGQPGRNDRPPLAAAGLDELAGGTWLGLNDDGVVAAVLNRRGSLGPEDGMRSRGELVLEALDHAEAEAAAGALMHLDPRAYRSFNLVIADAENCYWLRNRGVEGPGRIEVDAPLAGLSMLTAGDLDDRTSPRIRTYLPRLREAEAPAPDPEDLENGGNWTAWQAIMASREFEAEEGPFAAMSLATDMGFGTVSSSLVALPAPAASFARDSARALWLFAPGRPDIAEYQRINLET